jgi:uncharacterized protein
VKYLDTSFVAPYYVAEPSSERVEAFLISSRSEWVVSYWTEVEFASLLTRGVRMGRMVHADAARVLGQFRQDMNTFYRVITPTTRDFTEAARLVLPDQASQHALRGPDALHLALAKAHDLTLYTLDKTLLRAARALGVAADDAGIL